MIPAGGARRLLAGIPWIVSVRWQFEVRRRLAGVDWFSKRLTWGLWCRLCAWSADAVVEELGKRSARPLRVVQIGSNDGSSNDPIHRTVADRHWTAVLVEPLPHLFEALVRNYEDVPGVEFVNAAIAAESGPATLYTVEPRRGDPDWTEQIASLDRDVVMRHTYALEGLADRIRQVEVEGVSMPDLVQRQGLSTIDLLHVDAEGYDHEVVTQVELEAAWTPHYLIFERKHMSADDYARIAGRLRGAGFRMVGVWPDQFAYRTAPARLPG